MEIIEFLKSKNKEEYDFSEDWKIGYDDKLLHKYKNMDLFFKYFVMKWQKRKPEQTYEKTMEFYLLNKESIGLLIDPDSESCLLQRIYEKLWGSNVLKYCTDNGKVNIHGDTMNTIQTTLSRYIRLVYANEFYSDKRDIRFFNHKLDKPYDGSLMQCTEIFLLTKEGFICNENERNILKKFIKYNHTLGNFIPIPYCEQGRFNGPRSKGGTDDFWDLTLFKIYEWVIQNNLISKKEVVNNLNGKLNNDKLKELLQNADNVNLFIAWFLSFADYDDENINEIWKKFIQKNYLEDYVNNNYEVVLYNNGIRINDYTVDNCIKYFEQATEQIINRTMRMICKLNDVCNIKI